VLLAEPYRVAREIEASVSKTDRMPSTWALPTTPSRLDAGILYALETLQEDGHTAAAEADLRDHAAELCRRWRPHRGANRRLVKAASSSALAD